LAIVGATTGKSAIVGKLENVTVQRSLAILRPDRSAISSSFLHYVIQSPVVQTEIALTVFKYSAQPGIYLDDVGRLPVVRPPLTEQAAIVASLDTETAKLEALAEKVQSAIDRLTEYRTALITAATTGKTDVREVQIPAKKPD
jgi:type I restriction enzyme S subunit